MSAAAIAAALAATATLGIVGADSRWLAALGEVVAGEGIPDGVPYASAPTRGWPNVLVAAELIFHWVSAFGSHGLLASQFAAVACGFALLAADAWRGGAKDGSVAVVLVLVAIGALASIVVIRLQLFSLALFPALLFLLRAETRKPTWRIWLVPPLLLIWGNLHGAVLLGYAVTAAYLLLHRARVQPVTAALTWLCGTLALLATPSLFETIDYYRGVLTNEAAKLGVGLWAPLSLSSPVDVLFVGVAVVLCALAVRARPSLWEIVTLVALAILTVRTARSGVWLLFVAAGPAARVLPIRWTLRPWIAVGLSGCLLAVAVAGLVRGPASTGASDRVLDAALVAADGTPILAEDVLAEQVALAGGRIWVGNPLDAFRKADQRLYLYWLEGRAEGDAALTNAPRVVLVKRGSRAAIRLRASGGVRVLAEDGNAIAYRR